MARDDRCDFGRWLLGFNPTASDRAHHLASKKLHAAFHVEAAKTLRLVSAGHQDQAQASILTGGGFAEASRLLTKRMIEWKKSVS